MTIELSEYVIDAIADAIVKKMQVPTEEEKALLQKWHDNRGISMKDFEDAMDALEQEPCEDAISRDAVCNIVDEIRDCISVEGYWAILERLKKLPPVTPQPKTGHWIRWYEKKETEWCIDNIPHCKCSECGKEYDPHSSQFIKYCNKCGAKMVEPQAESEG